METNGNVHHRGENTVKSTLDILANPFNYVRSMREGSLNFTLAIKHEIKLSP